MTNTLRNVLSNYFMISMVLCSTTLTLFHSTHLCICWVHLPPNSCYNRPINIIGHQFHIHKPLSPYILCVIPDKITIFTRVKAWNVMLRNTVFWHDACVSCVTMCHMSYVHIYYIVSLVLMVMNLLPNYVN